MTFPCTATDYQGVSSVRNENCWSLALSTYDHNRAMIVTGGKTSVIFLAHSNVVGVSWWCGHLL